MGIADIHGTRKASRSRSVQGSLSVADLHLLARSSKKVGCSRIRPPDPDKFKTRRGKILKPASETSPTTCNLRSYLGADDV